jgi:SAM-dependent methyltransferase
MSSTTADPAFNGIRYLPTNEAYDRWAAVYDTDGNFLQALDTEEMKTLFPRLLEAIQSPSPWKVVDLGCGTGRNTALLLTVPNVDTVVAVDASQGMLEVARQRLQQEPNHVQPARPALKLAQFDMLAPPPAAVLEQLQQADAIISTLVVEHIPLPVFFGAVAQCLRPGGVLLLTNMHADMGSISQAGFVDTESGEKIRPTSYAHTIAEVLEEAAKWGLTLEREDGEDGMRERSVQDHMIERLGPRSRKWLGIRCWFGGLFRMADSPLEAGTA